MERKNWKHQFNIGRGSFLINSQVKKIKDRYSATIYIDFKSAFDFKAKFFIDSQYFNTEDEAYQWIENVRKSFYKNLYNRRQNNDRKRNNTGN